MTAAADVPPPLRHIRGSGVRAWGGKVQYLESLCGMWLREPAFEGDGPRCRECQRLEPVLGNAAHLLAAAPEDL